MCNYVVIYYDINERIKFEYVMAESYREAKNMFTVKNPCDRIAGIYINCADLRTVLYSIV